METEYLIIGQGISGTMLSWFLKRNGHAVYVIDSGIAGTSSGIAAGLINPVTGRRIVTTWMIDELMPFAWKSYTEMGMELGIDVISSKEVIDFFPSPQMLLAFRDRLQDEEKYLSLPASAEGYRDQFNYDFGYGVIRPVYVTDLCRLLPVWRKKLAENGELSTEEFEFAHLHTTEEKVEYKDVTAQKIIFCDGTASIHNPYFKNLPFAFNKGEALLIRCAGLGREKVYKKTISVIPYRQDLFWVGSSYEWNFDDALPSASFLEKTKSSLNHWLKLPYTIMDHLSAVRPATIERRPFVGMHPSHPRIGILNGMGTKGCSLAPWFASQFANFLSKNQLIPPEVNVNRFSRLLKLQ